MSRFPATFRKTMWRKMSASQQANACDAILAVIGIRTQNSDMAVMRGIPDNPAWIKERPTSDDIDFLRARARRRIQSDGKMMKNRVKAAAKCQHEWSITEGVATKACIKCGRIEVA